MFHREQRAEHVDIEDGGVTLGRLLDDGRGIAFGTGGVHRDVQSTKAGDRPFDERLNLIFEAHVGLHELGFGAERAKFIDELLANIGSAARNDHGCLFLGKCDGRGAADTGQSAGYENHWCVFHLVLQIDRKP
ncbi:hypothetical protein BTHE68_42080 [Burkholderia sp. THE68]|nr:hypothetical protein BTHE68_42080 [Burkholderia sp. THE68]